MNAICRIVRQGKGWKSIAAIIAALLTGVPNVSGQLIVILSNNFESVATGAYSQYTHFGTDELLGRTANLVSSSVDVVADSGTGGSAGVGRTGTSPAIASRVVSAITLQTEFSMYFKLNPEGTANMTPVGAGFSTGLGVSNVFYNSNASERFLVGLQHGGTAWSAPRFASFGQMDSGVQIAGSPTAALTIDNWYQLSFRLHHDGTNTWEISHLALRDWGASGATGGSVLMEMASASVFDPAFGGSLTSTQDFEAHAVFAANRTRASNTFDNLYAAAIPEPGTFLLTGIGLAVILKLRRWFKWN